MIDWQPHPPALSDTGRARPASEGIAELLELDHTAAFVVPVPGEAAVTNPGPGGDLLAELIAVEPLRRPLITKLTALVRRLGVSDSELVGLARELWATHAHRQPGVSAVELADIPVRRSSHALG